MAEQAYAYVTLIPVAKGFKSALTKELNGVQGAGNVAGEKTGSGFAGGFKKALGGLAIAGAAATAALGGVLASGFARLSGIEEAQAKLVGLGNSVDDVSQIMDNALSAVRGTAFGMADAATIAASAVAAGVQPGEELARYLKITADSAYIAGAGLDEMGSILNKATTRGVATNEVLTQLAERGIPIYQMLADTVGVTAGEIFDLASQGEISSKVLMDSLENNIAGAALESGNTVTGAFANMRAAIQRVGANLLGPSFGYFKDFFLGIIAFLGPVEEKAKVVGQVIADFLGDRLIPYFSDLFLIGEKLGADNVFAKVFDDIRGAITGFFEGGALGDVVAKIGEFRLMIFNAIIEAVPAILDAIVQFLPVLIDFFANTMLPQLIAQFETIINEIISLVTLLLPGLVQSLLEMIPSLIDAGIKLFNTLVQAVIDITPDLIDAIIFLLPEIIETLLGMLPQLVESAVQLFTALVQAVPKIIPPLITAIIDLLPLIIDTLIEMLPELIDAAFDLFTGIVTAIYEATPDIIASIAGLLPQMISTVLGFIPQFFRAGADIIGGLARGIIESGPRILGSAISSVVNGVISGAKALLGINSPSKVFAEMGQNIGDGLINGIEGTYQGVKSAADGLAVLATGSTAGSMGLDLNTGGPTLSTSGASVTMPVNRFESAEGGMAGGKTVNYYAAPNQSIDSEQELFQAMRRAKVVANW